MRAIMATVVALSVLAGVTVGVIGAAYAADDFPRDFWKQQERNLP